VCKFVSHIIIPFPYHKLLYWYEQPLLFEHFEQNNIQIIDIIFLWTYLDRVLFPFGLRAMGDLLLKTLRALASALLRLNVLPLKLLDALFLTSSDLEFKNFKNENIMNYTNLKWHVIWLEKRIIRYEL